MNQCVKFFFFFWFVFFFFFLLFFFQIAHMEPTWFHKWSEEAGLNRKSVMALKKVECTDDRTISLLRQEDINRLLGQNELTLGQAMLLSPAVHKLNLPATIPLPVVALYDPFGVDVPLNCDTTTTHCLPTTNWAPDSRNLNRIHTHGMQPYAQSAMPSLRRYQETTRKPP